MDLNRRAFVLGLPAAAVCSALPAGSSLAQQVLARSTYQAIYAPIDDDLYPIPGVDLSKINQNYLRKVVPYETSEAPGTIVIDPRSRYLYLVLRDGMAVRYGVGVGRSGFSWSGTAVIKDKQEWPDWYPPKEMFGRQPELMEQMGELPGGAGMPGGPGNPLGARAMYLWQGNKDTLYRIHGTFEPWTIGTNVSSGCIRMINQDVIDLYNHTPIGTKVVVLGSPGNKRNHAAPRA
ncbi:L,D-transpeptidase [Microvirga sp. KLBC 81]|uniref:L,D-transpeptidase n=1 Tax=Microvirga sp. KLBC 81 TaxID=1862707 RepID=UPI000D51FFC0|nr:L,D-transpeptidase [Microvirga sp. KLBC 81]PVE21619.1 L,D-transpeptidase [Microvirga sp. KLBC 81]